MSESCSFCSVRKCGSQLRRRLHARKRNPKCYADAKLDYKTAGVDIDAGNELVERIKRLNPDIGGFNGMFPFGDDYLVGSTDGVGTKLKLAFEMGDHSTIGIDLVAMVVNDIIVCGARPLFFLDYFATGGLNVDVAETVVKGIVAGCSQCGTKLMGGETAEMPGMYAAGEYDLAGFAVGSVPISKVIDGSSIEAGDVLLGLPSSGVHSNGFSLVRKVIETVGLSLQDPAPWDASVSAGASLLTPTRIYVNQVLSLIDDVGGIKGVVHVTGGGFPENLPRVLPNGCSCSVNLAAWDVPPVFKWLQKSGGVKQEEMYRTFNMGVGMVLIVGHGQVEHLLQKAPEAFVIGKVEQGSGVSYV